MKKYKVGILGATGMVGRQFLTLLADHPWFDVSLLAASSRSAGKTYGDIVLERGIDGSMPNSLLNMVVKDAVVDAKKIVQEVDFVFCAVDLPKDKTVELEEMYAKLECPVVSNNSAHRTCPDVPVVIPEINAHHLDVCLEQQRRLKTNRGFIVAKSNCSLQSYVPALHPLLKFGLSNVLVCTYQAISGAGKTFDTWPEMFGNVIPYINGEEEKSETEPLKIWGTLTGGKIINASKPNITAQCIRIPVLYGHMAAVFVSLENRVSSKEIIELWDKFESEPQRLNLPSAPKNFLHYFEQDNRPQITSEVNLEKGMAVSIGRLRPDSQYDYKFVSLSHNTIRGAAGGAVLIAELLCTEPGSGSSRRFSYKMRA